MMKSKKSSLVLTLGTAAALAVGGGTAYWFFSQRGAGPADLLMGSEVVPQDALMAVSVTTDAGQWQQMREFGTKQSQTALDQNLAQLRDRFLTANGFNYDKDIRPWVGKEVTLAFLPTQIPPVTNPPTNPPPALQQQATIAVLPIQDPLKAKQVLEQPRTGGGGALTERTYKGVQIRESKGPTLQPFSAAVLDGKFLLITTDPKATERAIDTYQGAPSLSSTPGYRQSLSKIATEQPFGKLYVNLPAAAAITATNSGRNLSAENLAQVQQNQGLAATMKLEPEGIRFQSVSWLKPDSQKRYEVQNSARSMPERLPADTLIMASGGNLQKFWQDYSQGASANPISPINPEALRSGLQSTVGLDLDKDLLAWMDGEFSLALVAAPAGEPANLPFSLVFMVKASDRRAAEKSLTQLNQAMTERYKFKVEESKVGNQTVTNWVLPAGGPAITYGWLSGDVVFLTLGAPIAASLVPQPANSLANSPVFQKTVPTKPNPNNGHFFVNVERAINAKSLPLFPLPPANRDLIAAVQSIGVTAAISDDRTARYDVFAAIQKAGKPNPLPSPQVPAASPPPAEPVPVSPSPSPSP